MTEEEKKRLSPYAVDEDTLYRRFVSDRPSYAGTYEQPLSDVYQQITSRPAFQYDATKDPLFQSYKDQYIQGGKLAMRDTLGQAAALTGGYGSSYGQQVGQQAYDAYLKDLSAVVPELYSAAYGRYQDEGDALRQQYAMLGQQRDTEYSRYLDELGAWQNERAYQTQLESTEYSRQQDAYSRLYSLILGIGYQPSQEELAAAGMRPEVSSALYAEYQRQHPAPVAAAPVYYYQPKAEEKASKNTLDSDVKALRSAGVTPSEINRFIKAATAKGAEYAGTTAQEKAAIRDKYKTLSR